MTQLEPSRQRTAVLLSLEAARDVFAGVNLTVDQRIGLGNVMVQAQANVLAEQRLSWERVATRRHTRTQITVAMIALVGAICAAVIVASAYTASQRSTAASARAAQHSSVRNPTPRENAKPASTARANSELAVGAALLPGHALLSPNRMYRLTLQTDGNIVEYGPYGALWDVFHDNVIMKVTRLVMQQDCNLVGYAVGGSYSTDTGGRGTGCILRLQDDGNTVILADGGYPIWDSFDAMQ
jgi:hypothetical protein